MKGYFVHLQILVLFLTLMTLGHGYDHDECLPRRCGNNGPEICFPFRLKHIHPKDCGYHGFDLLCTEKGETALELPFPLLNGTQLPFPVKFLIEYIDYEFREIVISRVDGCLLQLLPLLNLCASPFSFEYPDDYTIFNCSSNSTSGETPGFRPITCFSKPGDFVYAVSSFTVLYRVTELISCTKMFQIPVPSELINYDRFVLNWTGPSWRPKNNSTTEDADYCYRKRPSRGAVRLSTLPISVYLPDHSHCRSSLFFSSDDSYALSFHSSFMFCYLKAILLFPHMLSLFLGEKINWQ